ncbi:hypothetical protein GZ77_16690 [Endozoicomonas montiporae]|uniref:Uncharacterized protein n=2 Tax=Endozoicomonas montiporae TaxID=1027273 RepID=A0A081N615_9GAMM|nr:hypothetical protein [Endozoicomonas montiporae]AMO57193.1 hypothetical protein EZMO1_3188 [Endozoicomonas montiporae CL-33]KEQ13888.1 hypothetical protein GZ77_16690 [Endozoicomonas montiporae]
MFKAARIAVLLLILIVVGGKTWLTQKHSISWEHPLYVAVHPFSGDNSEKTKRYIAQLDPIDFAGMERFLAKQAQAYGVDIDQPISMYLAEPLSSSPPEQPDRSSTLAIMLWSLKFRYWNWQTKRNSSQADADIHLYVVYFDPDSTPVLQHSIGMQKSMAGIVNAYGDRRYTGSNHVVMTHELLHTLGATDKYNLQTGLPQFPEGYAEPGKKPLYPQRYAEIMGGHIPIDTNNKKMPTSLRQITIGWHTAREINWVQAE